MTHSRLYHIKLSLIVDTVSANDNNLKRNFVISKTYVSIDVFLLKQRGYSLVSPLSEIKTSYIFLLLFWCEI